MGLHKVFTIYFVFLVAPLIVTYSLYDIFAKDNPISFLLLFTACILWVVGFKELRNGGNKDDTNTPSGS
ncbi:membrane protein [Arthrobacter phage Qui]|jgi:hypothetical protein|uniref:Membrane protein n=1 Tax=Arthrobacter phage Qui TaxID=2603260 RepID=A0A5B8WKC5_9CAUD|nr:membrane protein [Arthrobacter phage Qui]QED11696.1 membrane protein [Arthrobacter phage Qui]QOC56527.1 membrane protein [Arthrobacter phage Paella]